MSEQSTPPQAPNEQEFLEAARSLLDDEGCLRFDRLSSEQLSLLADMRVLAGAPNSEFLCPNILDPTTVRVEQLPLHEIEDTEEFLSRTNNFYGAFCDKSYPPIFNSWAHWHRFAIVAPELNTWLQQHEREFQAKCDEVRGEQFALFAKRSSLRLPVPERSRVHMAALRLAYQIVAQLICEDDPYVSYNDRLILMH